MGYWCIKHENVLVTQYNPCLLCEIDRQGWEQAKREAAKLADQLLEYTHTEDVGAAIAAMEYKESTND